MGDQPHYLLIRDGYGNWGFPKGHIDEGESPDVAARREILEETGLNHLILRAPLGMIDWYFRHDRRLIHKYCHYYLFESRAGGVVPQVEEGIAACVWHPEPSALENVSYENARAILRTAVQLAPGFCPRND